MPSRSGDRGRVWLLEDSALEAEMARRALAASQDVEHFTDGSVLLERAASGALPDVVVLDCQLPGIGGTEVCRVLRATNDAIALPVLMLTVEGGKTEIVDALAAGANDYVTKPYDVTELVARVGTLVRTSRLNAVQARRARQLALAADVGAILTRGGSLEDIGRRVADNLTLHMEASVVEVWMATRDGRSLLARSGATIASPVAPELVRAVADQKIAFSTDDAASEPRLAGLEGRVRGFAAIPLVVRDELVGVLAVGTRHAVSDASAALATVADLLALGFARARADEERVAVLERERATRADAEAANRSKDEFLAMVSHELRTPLNAITGWAGMLLNGGLDAARTQRAIETIERNARAQAQLIDDLLDVSRIITGKLRLAVGKVDVASIADLALESVRLAADAKGVALDSHVADEVGTVSGDAERIQQVVWNLLTNAIKFTPRGGKVTLLLDRTPEALTIAVADTGQGIATDFLPYVFDRFKQADGSPTRQKGGLGLGLAIVRHIVELHGGTISVESEGEGRGATFTASFPLDAQIRAASSAVSPRAHPTPVSAPREVEGMRILVIDDEPDARELLRTLLESCRVDVTTASSAAEGFELLQQRKHDVVLSDIAMPGEDGLSFIRRVRALPRESGGRIPALALTAYARLEDRTRALLAGFNGHVAKPVEPSELLAMLSSLVTSR
jgi:signal transduction histidine kinase/DNA-binding response OmpR family regulator